MPATRPSVTLAALALVVVVSGCESNDAAPQGSAPVPQYQQTPKEICVELQLEAIFEKFDLNLPSDFQPDSGPRTERTHWRQLCTFVAYGNDERYSTSLGEFRPIGTVQVRVYQDLASAEAAYDQDAQNYFDLPQERDPDTTTADLTGWWGDSGRSLTTAKVPNPDHLSSGIVVHEVHVIQLIRHGNLVLMADSKAIVPLPDTAAVTALLKDLTSALIDESVTHLDRE